MTTVWLKWPISFYSGKDLCTEGRFQLLLYFTRAALPTLPIDGCHKDYNLASSLKTMSQLKKMMMITMMMMIFDEQHTHWSEKAL